MNLILLEPGDVAADGHAVITGVQAAHVRDVLRAMPGQTVRVGVVDGPRGTGTVTALDGDSIALACAFEPDPPPRPRVDLLLALPRPKVLRRLWAQIAALGVDRVMLTNAERVERHYFDTHVVTPAVYRPLLIEGLQQARDTRLPRVTIHRRFRVLIEDDLDALAGSGARIVAHPGTAPPLPTVVGAAPRVLLAVGPEGGWNGFELGLLESHGFLRAALGARPLRTDTACVALLALTHASLAPGVSSHAPSG